MLIHLDIGVPDLDEGVAFALEAGHPEAAHQPQDDVRVMLDPSGHVFCLFADPLDHARGTGRVQDVQVPHGEAVRAPTPRSGSRAGIRGWTFLVGREAIDAVR